MFARLLASLLYRNSGVPTQCYNAKTYEYKRMAGNNITVSLILVQPHQETIYISSRVIASNDLTSSSAYCSDTVVVSIKLCIMFVHLCVSMCSLLEVKWIIDLLNLL